MFGANPASQAPQASPTAMTELEVVTEAEIVPDVDDLEESA